MSRLDPMNNKPSGAVYFCSVCLEDGKLVHLTYDFLQDLHKCTICRYELFSEDIHRALLTSKA